ncbi:MAG: hypothetical protein RL220_1956, partial [Bacteroidota bacterium]
LLNAAKYEEAIPYFREAGNLDGVRKTTRALMFRNQAQCYLALQMNDSAVKYSIAAAQLFEPESYEYLINMADVDLLSGHVREATEKLEKAFAINPDDVAACNSLGLIYLGEYDYESYSPEKALPFNQKAFQINRDRTTEEVLSRNYFALEKYEDCEKHLMNIYSTYRGMTDVTFSLGVVKWKQNQFAMAEKFFEEAIAADSSYRLAVEEFKFMQTLEQEGMEDPAILPE